MSTLNVLIVPDPRLRQKAEAVGTVTPEIQQLMDNMLETMDIEDGAGLAAVQVGVMKRVITIDLGDKHHDSKYPRPLCIADPVITHKSAETVENLEGCLSIPAQDVPVTRSKAIKLKYLNRENEPCDLEADGWMAICIQHELDHLDGILTIDYVSPLKRRMFIERAQKEYRKRQLKAQEQ